MAHVDDVAAYVLKKRGTMTTWKLQKLLYYSQAWMLAWKEKPLFDAQIEAWANGPVVRDIYTKHRGQFSVSDWNGDPDAIGADESKVIDVVLDAYGQLDGRQLSHLTHSEDPWQHARGGLAPTDRSTAVITPSSMMAFYQALDADESAKEVDELDWSSFEQ